MHRRMRSRVEGRSILGREKYQKEISFNMEMLSLLRQRDRVRKTREKRKRGKEIIYTTSICFWGTK